MTGSSVGLGIAEGDSPAAASQAETVQERVLQTPEGPQRFSVHQAINANGELEIQVEHEELRALIPGETRAVVLYGRDLDGDGKIDAWFYVDRYGIIQAVDSLAMPSSDAWEAASEIILRQDRYRNRWFVGLLANSILSRMTLTDGMGQSFRNQLLQEEIDLRDLGIRVARLQKENPLDPTLLKSEILLSDSWADLSQRISSEGIRDRFLYAAGDVALYLSGAAAVKGLGAAAKWGIPKLAATAPGSWAGAAYDGLCAGISELAANAADAVSEQAARLGIDSEALEQLKDLIHWPAIAGAEQGARAFLVERVPEMIRGLNARGRVASVLAKSIGALTSMAKGSLKRWKYIAATQSLQLGTEIYNRRNALFSPNPIVFAKRVLTNKDLLQDLTFMTLDTTLQTGVSTADTNVKRRMVICGILSLVDSKTTNLIVNKASDARRNALDTGWEVSVGNIETQIDVSALQKFEMMAERQGNPKLALIGYAIALTDDTLGSYAYEKLTSRYEEHKKAGKPIFSWIPVFAPK